MPAGRRPKPLEQRRLSGRSAGRDSGGRALPDSAKVHALPSAGDRVPTPPSSLGEPGLERWTQLWTEARDWLSPGADRYILVRLCEAEDMRQGMREALAETGFYVVGSMGQQRPNPLLDKLRALDQQITQYEQLCGLTPSDRGRLGVGEVKANPTASPLNRILQQAADRGARRQA